MTSWLLSVVVAASVSTASSPVTPVTLVPLTGAAPDAEVLTAIEWLPGIASVALDGDNDALSIEVVSGAEVSIRDLSGALAQHAPDTQIARDGIRISTHTIIQLNAGVCFFCAEEPLGQALARRPFVVDWSVVDYRAKGRLRFRLEAMGGATIGKLGGTDAFEDIVLTDRYDGLGAPDLYWATGGVEWRADEATARREATRSRKPLVIFPTAGT